MKYFLPVVLNILLITNLNAQEFNWKPLKEAPVAGRFDDISFINQDTGWAVNSSGEIYKTETGGTNWIKLYQSAAYLRSVGFANDSVGWAGTILEDTILYLTTDGGVNWKVIDNIPEPKPLRICGISVLDDSTMFACGSFDGPARFIKTNDRGKTWTVKDMYPLAGTLIDCYFLDKNRGYVVGGNIKQFSTLIEPLVLYTEDGGETWQKRYEGKSNGWCWKITFPTPTTGYISIENFDNASVLKTTDGGEKWTRLTIPDNYDIQGIGFINENVGWVGGYGENSITRDGGLTWELVYIGDRINRFRFVNDTVAYASGRTIYKYTKSGVTSVEAVEVLPDNFILQQNYPNPFNISTTINYILPEPSNVKIRIFNSLGQDVKVLVYDYKDKGLNSVVWNGTNSKEEVVSSGIYIYRIDTDQTAESKVMVLLK